MHSGGRTGCTHSNWQNWRRTRIQTMGSNRRYTTAATPQPPHHSRYTTAATPQPLHHRRYTNAATPLPLHHTTATPPPLYHCRYTTSATPLPLHHRRYTIVATPPELRAELCAVLRAKLRAGLSAELRTGLRAGLRAGLRRCVAFCGCPDTTRWWDSRQFSGSGLAAVTWGNGHVSVRLQDVSPLHGPMTMLPRSKMGSVISFFTLSCALGY